MLNIVQSCYTYLINQTNKLNLSENGFQTSRLINYVPKIFLSKHKFKA